MKKIILLLTLISGTSFSAEPEFHLLSREPDPNCTDKYITSLLSISLADLLSNDELVVEGKPKLLWSDSVKPTSLIEKPICRHFREENLLYYMYVQDVDNDGRTIKLFDLRDPAHPRDVPKDYYEKTSGCFYLPQFDLEHYSDKFFILFMNYDINLLNAQERLNKGEITFSEHREIQRNAKIQSPKLKSYSLESVHEMTETNLDPMTRMGEGLTVFLSPNGEINYGGYGLANDKIKLAYHLPDTLTPSLKITEKPEDNAWLVVRNRAEYLILESIQEDPMQPRNQTLIYFKNQNLWEIYSSRYHYDVVESNGFLILHFLNTEEGSDHYMRRKLCIDLKNGARRNLFTEIDSEISYFDGSMTIIKNESGFEILHDDELVKFIYYPNAKYVDNVFLSKW